MNERIVLCLIICVTVIALYILSIVKSTTEKKRLEKELELLREEREIRPPHKPIRRNCL
jgi:hypothetical protein